MEAVGCALRVLGTIRLMDVSGAISKMATHKKMMSLPWLNSIKWALDELHSEKGDGL